jgi:pimeloyl-ACP methyl ester carboxylesterase
MRPPLPRPRSARPTGWPTRCGCPTGDPWAGVVIIHGAGSSKESHHDFARAARSAGLSAVCFDQRGHGDSGGELDGRALEDVATVAALLGDVPLVTRGSSMGGYLAILAAERLGAAAVVAICPASSDGLWRGLRRRRARLPRRTSPASSRSTASTRSTSGHLAARAAAPARRGRRARPVGNARAARLAPNAELGRRPRRATPLGPARRRAARSRLRLAAEGRLAAPRRGGRGRRRCVASWRRRGGSHAALANRRATLTSGRVRRTPRRDEGEEEHQDEQRDDLRPSRPSPSR